MTARTLIAASLFVLLLAGLMGESIDAADFPPMPLLDRAVMVPAGQDLPVAVQSLLAPTVACNVPAERANLATAQADST